MACEEPEVVMAPENELDEEEIDEVSAANAQQLSKVAPAIISIHPSSTFVVVSVGAGFRVFNLERNEAVTPVDATTSPSGHRSAIRAARFNHTGSCFVSAGDDKLVKFWDVSSWTCIRTITVNKKLSAVTFSKDGLWLLVADKFGVVYVTPTRGDEKCEEPAQLLAHCCSIITSLEISPCGKFVVTADRDFKIRVSVFPPKPELGAYEIQSFCLGHASFVSCLAFVRHGSSDEGLLVSGGGDSTIRLWDYVDGTMLDVLEIDDDMKVQGEAAVVNLAATGATIAATVERFAGVLILSCDTTTKKLSLVQKILLHELICPTGLQFETRERLWLIAGGAETRDVGDRALTPEQIADATSHAQAAFAQALTRLRVLQSSGSEFQTVDDDSVPGSSSLLNALQGRAPDSGVSIAKAVAEAAEAAELAMKQLLSKRQYSDAQRELRKRSRNDKKKTTS